MTAVITDRWISCLESLICVGGSGPFERAVRVLAGTVVLISPWMDPQVIGGCVCARRHVSTRAERERHRPDSLDITRPPPPILRRVEQQRIGFYGPRFQRLHERFEAFELVLESFDVDETEPLLLTVSTHGQLLGGAQGYQLCDAIPVDL